MALARTYLTSKHTTILSSVSKVSLDSDVRKSYPGPYFTKMLRKFTNLLHICFRVMEKPFIALFLITWYKYPSGARESNGAPRGNGNLVGKLPCAK